MKGKLENNKDILFKKCDLTKKSDFIYFVRKLYVINFSNQQKILSLLLVRLGLFIVILFYVKKER